MPTALVVVGTRPEAIKLAPVIRRMSERGRITPLVVSTAQHGDTVDRMLATFGLRPDVDLDVLRPGDDLTGVTTRTLTRTAALISDVAPDAVVVQGDTTAALAGSLAAFQTGVRIVHVEAGLRTGDRSQPYPEEMNRRLIGQLADVHCTPTPRARDNLLVEGVAPNTIHVTGNTVVDALRFVIEDDGRRERGTSSPVVVTLHRRESWGAPLERLADAIARLASTRPEVDWIFPMHPNPTVRTALRQALAHLANVRLVEPPDYPDFVHLIRGARFVLTDSGGIQEEAPTLGIPVFVLRDRTERPEVLETGLVRLVGTDAEVVAEVVERQLQQPPVVDRATAPNPVGDGRAAERVEAAVAHHLGLGSAPPPFVPGETVVETSVAPAGGP